MNAIPAPDGHPYTHERGGRGTQAPLGSGAESVPRQKTGSQESEGLRGATTDLLEHPDPHTAAQAAAIENLLRCWVREHDLAAPDDGTLRIPLPASGTALVVPVHYWSPTGWHRFGPPYLSDASDQAPPTDAVTLAALLGREAPTIRIPVQPDAAAVTATAEPVEPVEPNTIRHDGRASRANRPPPRQALPPRPIPRPTAATWSAE